ncbi:DUF1542 domain-containing protein [Lactobacillus reuteri]|nr:DUF1542 domain-containing protein [Limosilactobacillus reuteri]
MATKSTDATDTPAATTNNEKVTANEATVQKTAPTSQGQSTNADQNQNSLDGTRQVLRNISNTASYRNNTNNVASLFGASFVATPTSEATTDNNSVTTVNTAQELIDAIQKGTATTINVANDINLGTVTDSPYNYVPKINNRDFTIQSATPGTKHTIDFSGYCFNMSSQNSVTFKDLNIYSRTYWGVVYNAGGYTFDNVDFTGSQLVYTKPSINSTVTFKNVVNATAVGSYTGPLDGKTRSSQGGNTQQILQFEGGNNKIIFDEGSNVTLTTTNSNVLEIDGGTTNIEVKNGANVTLNPHSKGKPELLNGMDSGIVARAIASIGTTNLTIDKNANLNINLNKESSDQDLSGALYLKSGATINVNGNLNITSDGQSSYSKRSDYVPVYINGTAAINVNGGSLKINATNMGDSYTGPIVSSNGRSTIAINHHGTFDITGDGTQAIGVSLGSGSTFTSTQPELFNVSMPDGATAIKNGKVQFKGVKTSADGQPIGEIGITYAANGTPTVTKVTSYDEATTTATRTAGNSAKNKINLVAAGEEVDLKDITFTKAADGNYIMSGNANTADNKGAYVYISVNGQVHKVAPTDSQTLWTAGETGAPTSSQVPYTAETGTDGKFTVNLGKLKDTDQVSVYGAKDFVTSDTDTKTVSDWMTSSYRDQLQKLVDEAQTVETGSNYVNATDNLKTAYTSAISDGRNLLQNPSATSEQLEAKVNAITNAKTALNGDDNLANAKRALQEAVNNASDIKESFKFYNADKALQEIYTNAITAGKSVLGQENPTVADLQSALDAIDAAKSHLNGIETDKRALQAAVNNSTDVTKGENYTNASQEQKAAYDKAINDANAILSNSKATQKQVDDAVNAIKTANNALNGDTNLQTSKNAATDAIDRALAGKTKEINDATNIDQTTKDKLINDATTAANTAKTEINNAKTTADVTNAQTTGTNNINKVAVPSLDDAKTKATKAVDDALNAQTELISKADNISSAEKQDLITKATKAANTAKENITKATTNDDAAQAGQEGVNEIEKIVPTSLADAKTKANQAIQDALTKKLNAIDATQNLTTDEKTELTNKANTAANEAKEKVAQATTNDEAAQAGQAGAAAIDAIPVPTESTVKQAAKEAVAKAADEKNQAIDASSLTDEEKAALKQEVTTAQNAADTAIDNAKTNTAVTKAKDTGISNIQNIEIPTKSTSKEKATADLTNAVDAAKAAID